MKEPEMPDHPRQTPQNPGQDAATPTQIPKRGWVQIFRRVKEEIVKDHIGIIAAGIAFYALLSIFPAIAALVAISGLFLDRADVNDTMTVVASILPSDAANIIHEQLIKVSEGTLGASLVALFGLGFAIYGATKGVVALIGGLNIAYDEEETRGLVSLYLTGFAMTVALVIGLTLAMGLIIILPVAVGLLGLGSRAETVIALMTWPVLAGFVILGLAVLYRFGPSRAAANWRWLSVGAVLATLIWIAASLGFSVYVRSFGNYTETYGTLGGVVILLTWLWMSAYVVLAGAELNAEIEHQIAHDTTTGPALPMGQRGAVVADTMPMGHHSVAASDAARGLGQGQAKASRSSATTDLMLAGFLASRAIARLARREK